MIKNSKRFFFEVAIICFFASLLIGEINIGWNNKSNISGLFFVCFFAAILIGNIISMFEKPKENVVVYYLLFFVTTLFWDLCFFGNHPELNKCEKINAVSGLISLNFSFIICSLNLVRYYVFFHSFNLKDIINNKVVIIICVFFVIMFTFNYSVWPSQIDTWTYCSSIIENVGKWKFSLADMSPLMMGGHKSYAYSVLLMIGQFVLPDYIVGQRIVNCILAVFTIVAFYLIVEKIWGKEKKYLNSFLTFIFAFSPLFYGISYVISTDFPLLSFYVILVYSIFYKNELIKIIMCLCICFSKETGFVLLTATYLGEALYLYYENGKKAKVLKKELLSLKRIGQYSVIFVYAIILLCGEGGWVTTLKNMMHTDSDISIPSNTNVWWHYPIFKIFEYFFMNFSWLIWFLLCLLFIHFYCLHKKGNYVVLRRIKQQFKSNFKYYIFIFIMYITFCVLGIAFFTYIHYRYVQLGHLFYVLCLGIIVDLFSYKKIRKELLLIPICILMFVESFITIDPVTYMALKSFDAGNGKMVSTRQYWYITLDDDADIGYYWEAPDDVMSQHYLADGMAYNREILGLQKVLEKIFYKIDYNPEQLIVIKKFGGWKSYTLGQLFGVMDENGWFWDKNKKAVVRYDTGIPIYFITDEELNEEFFAEYKEIYYFDFKFNKYYSNDVLNEYFVLNKFTETYFRWAVDVYKLEQFEGLDF